MFSPYGTWGQISIAPGSFSIVSIYEFNLYLLLVFQFCYFPAIFFKTNLLDVNLIVVR